MKIKLDELFGEYGMNEEQTKTFWMWIRKHNIYGIFFEGIEFEPQYRKTFLDSFLDLDSASNFDVDKVYFKSFGYIGQVPRETMEGNVKQIEKTWFQEWTLREVFTEIKVEFE